MVKIKIDVTEKEFRHIVDSIYSNISDLDNIIKSSDKTTIISMCKDVRKEQEELLNKLHKQGGKYV